MTADPSNSPDESTEEDSPSLRQKLHWATGDRDKEAEALADRSPDDVSEKDAKIAVNRAHGDSPDDVSTAEPLASPADAEKVADERSD